MVCIGISLFTYMSYLRMENNKLTKSLVVATNNYKAYASINSTLKHENLVFKMSTEQLHYYNDSIIDKLNKVQAELKIKDKNLKTMQYYKESFSKKDTIILYKKIFINDTKLDTIIGNNHYKLSLKLRAPNIIIAKPSFNNEFYIYTTSRKETIKPPKKWWLFRLFQKKHTVVTIKVKSTNPYSKIKEKRFIEIIK